MRVKILALGLLLAAGAASAQDRVDEQRPLAADGTVVIEIGNGALRVMGWDKATVSVTGTLNSDAERLSVRGDRSKTRVEVVPLRHDHPAGADLEVHVPAGSRVEVESFQAAVTVEGISGSVRAETVNSAISLSAGAEDAQLESVNGAVTVRGRCARLRAESTNGAVTIADPGGELQAGTVNGPLVVTGARALSRGRLESVNGRVSFEGQLVGRGTLDVETVGGAVDLTIAGPADFKITTFNGPIVNELGPPARRSHESGEDDDSPGKELTFAVGSGGGHVTVNTLNGRVRLLASH